MTEIKDTKGKKIEYVEPSGYFPKELRKKYELGEYNKDKPQKLNSGKK